MPLRVASVWMSLVLTCAAGVAAADACTASTLAGYKCQETVSASPEVTVHYALAEDKATLDLAVEAEVSGYAALGVGTGMTTSQIVLGYVDDANAEDSLLAFTTTTRTAPSTLLPIATTAWVANASVTEEGGRTTTAYTYVLLAGGKIADTSAAPFVWALHSDTDGLVKHSKRGKVTLNLDATPVAATPETAVPTTSEAPRSEAPRCVKSTLLVSGGSQTYDCVVQILEGLAIHYSLLPDSRLFALQSAAAGYLAIGFPDTARTMGPGAALISTGSGAAKYRIGSSRTAAAVQLSDAVLPNVAELDTAAENGVVVMSWTETVPAATGREGSVQQSDAAVLGFNYAYHTSSNSLTQHTDQDYFLLNLQDGSVEVSGIESKQDKVKAHAAVQTLVWAFLVPLAVLVKRFGPMGTKAEVKGYPVPFVVHAFLMVVGVILTISMVALALEEFEGRTEKGHKGTGITVMSAAILQVVMQVAKCDGDSPRRVIFKAVHMGVGVATMALAFATLFTGLNNYERLYSGDNFARDTRVAVIVGLVTFVVAYIVASVVKARTGTPSQQAPTHPEQGEEEGGKSSCPDVVV